MNFKLLLILMLTCILASCEFRKSVSQDVTTGLATQGDGLSCESVYLSGNGEKLSRTTFMYGEEFHLNFEDVQGFKDQDGQVFPGMRLQVISESGDTVLNNSDLYAEYKDGITISPLLLQAQLTTGAPIHSNTGYTLYVNIWDKKGEGTFKANMGFEVVPNDQLKIESKRVSYDEIYLFAQKKNTVITNNKVSFNENIYVLFEGLEGFTEEDGKVFPGLSIIATDASGEVVLSEEDLVGETDMNLSELHDQVAPSIIFTEPSIQSPVSCQVVLWDKKSESRIQASFELMAE